eukprot:scaffold2991_cov250-Pinguiococcus_pyrenoidosus.AAC.7
MVPELALRQHRQHRSMGRRRSAQHATNDARVQLSFTSLGVFAAPFSQGVAVKYFEVGTSTWQIYGLIGRIDSQ